MPTRPMTIVERRGWVNSLIRISSREEIPTVMVTVVVAVYSSGQLCSVSNGVAVIWTGTCWPLLACSQQAPLVQTKVQC